MQTRKLGRHDVTVSVLGLGGMVVAWRSQDEADREVAAAIDRGITYFDVAPQYGDAQQILGPALAAYRDGVTLACKTLERTAAGSAAELDDSLAKLRTDHFDIYQLHSLRSADDTRQALRPGGAIETLLDAKASGKTQLIGFSAHDEEAALIAIESGHFDTVMFPLNFSSYEQAQFGKRLLAAANEREMGVLALKAVARTSVGADEEKSYGRCWYHPEDRPEIAELMLRYTLNLPGVAAALPPGDPALFHHSVDVAAAGRLAPLEENERQILAGALAEHSPLFPLPA